jgi:hypothetical protein
MAAMGRSVGIRWHFNDPASARRIPAILLSPFFWRLGRIREREGGGRAPLTEIGVRPGAGTSPSDLERLKYLVLAALEPPA